MPRKKSYKKSTKVTYGKTFRTKKGRYGKYKYVNGRRVGFKATKRPTRRRSF